MRFFGCAYYPEAWNTERRLRDIPLMQRAGFNLVRMGEFAWHEWEPAENDYRAEIFLETVRALHTHGIFSMICTPTAAPPRWMIHRYPEILKRDVNGNPQNTGNRRVCCVNSPRFREFSRNITSFQAKVFAQEPGVISWQLDNEIAAEAETGLCFCNECVNLFRMWLRKKYKNSLEALNQAWNGAFWATKITDWEEIRPPFSRKSIRLDYLRFQSDSHVEFLREQYDLLKKANPEWTITANSWTNFLPDVVPQRLFKHLDVASCDTYVNENNMPFFRAMWDFYRNVCGERRPFAVGETGAWNDNTKSPNSFKALRAWYFEALARGADSHLFFRWHKSLMGEEEHPAILPWSGRPGHAFRIIEEIAREQVRLPEHLPLPECRTAILTGEVNGFLDKFITEHPATKMLVRDSDILNRLGIVSDILPLENEQADWSPYKLLILPMMKHLPESAVEKLKEFAAAGGKILAQCRFHTVNDSGAYFEAPSPFEMKELMGFEIHESSPILEFNDWKEFKINTCAPPENNQELSAELFGESVHCYGWMEEAEIHGATTFGRYLEGCYQNAPLLLQRNGFFYQTAPLDVRGTELVLRHVLAEAGQETRREMLPEEVTLLRRGPVWFAINSSARKVKFEWNHEMICLEPYEICIKQAILPENGKK